MRLRLNSLSGNYISCNCTHARGADLGDTEEERPDLPKGRSNRYILLVYASSMLCCAVGCRTAVSMVQLRYLGGWCGAGPRTRAAAGVRALGSVDVDAGE